MLKAGTDKYVFSALPPSEDKGELYFPDAVLDPVIAEARQVVPEVFVAHRGQASEFSLLGNLQISERKFSLQESKALILGALNTFDPALGKKAENIFAAGFDKAAEKAAMPGFRIDWGNMQGMDGDRWRIAEGNRMMRCQPALSQATEFDPVNPNDYAVIDFEFDSTVNGLIYLAHELGHAIADDNENAAGYTAKDGPAHMDELQAYYVQHIVYDALKQHPDADISTAARRHFSATMADNLYQIPVSLAALQAQQNMSHGRDTQPSGALKEWLGGDAAAFTPVRDVLGEIDDARSDNDAGKLNRQIERLHVRPPGILIASGLYHQAKEQDMHGRQLISDAVLSFNGPKNIREVLAIAGIERNTDMQKLARTAIGNVAEEILTPLQSRRLAVPSSQPTETPLH